MKRFNSEVPCLFVLKIQRTASRSKGAFLANVGSLTKHAESILHDECIISGHFYAVSLSAVL